jgi:hypothetical protein
MLVVPVILLLVGTGTCVYLWRYSVQHNVVRYVVDPVTVASQFTGEQFASMVASAAKEWNKAAGRTIIWRFPWGRSVHFSLDTQQPVEDYAPVIDKLKDNLARAESRYDAASAAYVDKSKPGEGALWRSIGKMLALSSYSDAVNDCEEVLAAARASKDAKINGWEALTGAPTRSAASIVITSSNSRSEVQALVLHAFGHVLGLSHSGNDVMSNAGTGTTITKNLGVEAAAGH